MFINIFAYSNGFGLVSIMNLIRHMYVKERIVQIKKKLLKTTFSDQANPVSSSCVAL